MVAADYHQAVKQKIRNTKNEVINRNSEDSEEKIDVEKSKDYSTRNCF